MNSNDDVSDYRECPLCAEMVKKKAKVCRYCRNWFGKNPLDPHNPFFTFLLVIVFLVGVELFRRSTLNDFSNFVEEMQVPFNPDTSGLEVKESQVVQKKYPLKVTGVLQNNGKGIWQSISLEIYLYNKDGQVLGVFKDYIRGTISPGGTRQFFFEQRKSKKKEAYNFSKYKIFVQNAYFVPAKKTKK